MKLIIDASNRETVHTYIAIGLIVIGTIFAGLGFYAEPVGEISSSVLGLVGEFLVLAGSLLGVSLYMNRTRQELNDKLDKYIKSGK